MNENLMNRIIIKNKSKLEKVLLWYNDNKWVDNQEFRAPLDEGIIIVSLEDNLILKIIFRTQEKNVRVDVSYPNIKGVSDCVYTIELNPQRRSILSTSEKIPRQNKALRRLIFQKNLEYDCMTITAPVIYMALMQFMAYYQENVEIQQQRFKPMPYMKDIKRNGNGRPIPIIRKTYTIKDFDEAALKIPEGIKRTWTAPSHEVGVRGHMRHLKSGKVVWVKPFTRYKGKGAYGNEYEL